MQALLPNAVLIVCCHMEWTLVLPSKFSAQGQVNRLQQCSLLFMSPDWKWNQHCTKTADLELDQALAHAMRSPVDIAKSSSEAPHADLDLAAHVGVAAQGGEEVLGWRGDLVGLHEPHIVGHC